MVGSKFNNLRFFPWFNLVLIIILLASLMVTMQQTKPVTQTPSQNNCPATLPERVAAADVIVSGSVFMVIPGGSSGAQVIIDPIKVYKGQVDTPTVIINARDDAGVTTLATDSHQNIHFQSGQPPYLLFLLQEADGTFLTSQCAGTRFLETGLTSEEQQLLGVKPDV